MDLLHSLNGTVNHSENPFCQYLLAQAQSLTKNMTDYVFICLLRLTRRTVHKTFKLFQKKNKIHPFWFR